MHMLLLTNFTKVKDSEMNNLVSVSGLLFRIMQAPHLVVAWILVEATGY